MALLFSLLTQRPLVAAILGVAAASLAAHLAVGLLGYRAAHEHDYFLAAPLRGAVAGVVVLIDVWLGTRWYRLPGLIADWTSRRRPQQPSSVAAATVARGAPSRWAVLGGLLYLTSPFVQIAVKAVQVPHPFEPRHVERPPPDKLQRIAEILPAVTIHRPHGP